ncbi:phenylalanine 4-monooxygenase [Undibacterium oligocarboniphilum]|uniref:Phenylalanine-4-hydroxylase n=1 Tax=Undibacterium oligocarboniphilum TaxID=666702 RepID=A0A850QPM8_9BURK|nr:phenylalanine 4-monooxygenase [Undibacterium oligocarboniphilum]MBC3870509.1 phenylalanine 4-monooxygenase [Undibacterium oligocarboniphilum]NVO78690.1 phenylalanine 4-monooxygenase [Undibacterium oligocarboniphilum]
MDTSVSNEDFLATVAEKSHGAALRGDYEHADAQYVVQQNWAEYSEAEHDLWRRLYQRQMALLPGRACDEFIDALHKMDAAAGIPEFEKTSAELFATTGWKIVAVPGLIPELTFFEHLANRRFPVTVWLRKPEEFNYIVEPDVFHDFFGHVPMLFNPVFADYMQRYGQGGLKAMKLGGLDQLARLYWYTVEFGLINTPQGMRIYGAGILSSGGEVEYCLTPGTTSRHIHLQIERCLNTLYKIDTYQETYFVIQNFQELFDGTAPDFAPYYERLKSAEPFPANALLPQETELLP